MKEQIKQYLKILLIIIILFIPLYISPIVKADSGWDTSYDSGGSFDYDYNYDYDYDSDYEYHGYYSGGNSNFFTSSMFFYFMVIVIILLIFSPKEMIKNPESPNKYIRYEFQDISQDLFAKKLPNESMALLKQEMFLHFIETQNAWMNFEYEELRSLCTDELYNSYQSQLETLKLKNGQNIMHDFNCHDIKITNIEEINKEIVLTVFMCIEFYDYVTNTKTKKIIRGNNSKTVLNNYIMTFVKEKDSKNKKSKKCPNCGAPNKNITSGECPYCNSTLVTKASRFVLSSKKNINR